MSEQEEPVPTTTTSKPIPDQVKDWLSALVAAGKALPPAGDGSDPDADKHFETYQQAVMADFLLREAAIPSDDEKAFLVKPGWTGKIFPATTSGDPELDAITAIASLVKDLDPVCKHRMFEYLARRYQPRVRGAAGRPEL